LRLSAAWKSHGGAALTVATVICGLEIPRWRCAYRGYDTLRPGNPTVALRLPWLRLSAAWKSHGGAALTVATVFAAWKSHGGATLTVATVFAVK
ncbi:MAG: hypothetical protein E7E12_18180, partial [Klebsiella sp.]